MPPRCRTLLTLLAALVCGPVAALAQEDEEVFYFDDEDNSELASETSPQSDSRTLIAAEITAGGSADVWSEGDLEDVYEARLRTALQLEHRATDRVRLVVGGRVDYFWAAPSAGDPALQGQTLGSEDRYELDLELTAAYLDATPWDGVHVRIGQQVFASGRLDVLTSQDPLGVYDARSGPWMDAGSTRLPQPGLRLDWDLASAVSLQVMVVPWFRAHRLRPTRDRYPSRILLGARTAETLGPSPSDADPSNEPIATELNLALAGPAPSLAWPQALIRNLYRLGGADVGLTAALAIEKTPLIYPGQGLSRFLLEPTGERAVGVLPSEDNPEPALTVRYPRYFMLGGELGIPAGPLNLAFEASYSPERHLYTAPRQGSGVVRPDLSHAPSDPRSRPAGVALTQVGAHADAQLGDSGAFWVEALYLRAAHQPHDTQRAWWGLDARRADYVVASVGLSWTLLDDDLRLGLAGMVAPGPSVIAHPRVEYGVTDSWFMTLGGTFAEGPPAPMFETGGTSAVALGGLFTHTDQVYLAVRWLP